MMQYCNFKNSYAVPHSDMVQYWFNIGVNSKALILCRILYVERCSPHSYALQMDEVHLFLCSSFFLMKTWTILLFEVYIQ